MKIIGSIFLILVCINISGQNKTANDVIGKIKDNVSCDWSDQTVDTFKEGDTSNVITGIAVAFMATHEVLKKAIEMNCNLIITHEPTYYNHLDNKNEYGNDEIVNMKRQFINDNHLIIWRFHDHWHRTKPDGIYVGVTNKLDWEQNLVAGTNNVFEFKPQTLMEFTNTIQNTFNEANIRVVGDPNMKFTKAALILGAPGSNSQISLLQEKEIEVIVAGETREWETVEYVRDAVSMGKKKAVILAGHLISEEAGMEYCAEWLSTFIKDVPIHFIPAKDPFWTLEN